MKRSLDFRGSWIRLEKLCKLREQIPPFSEEKHSKKTLLVYRSRLSL